MIATDAVSRATPDGNTMLQAENNFVIAPHLKRTSYDPRTSFEPICHLARSTFIIAVNGTSPYRTLADLLGSAREAGRAHVGKCRPCNRFAHRFRGA
jgi:tripartite-type tricarboxylate transporter receptor subunit TctC